MPNDGRGGMALIAYNDMPPVRHPETDETVHLISLGTRHAKGGAMRNPNELGPVPGISSGTRKGTTASAGCSIQIIRYPTEPAAVCVQPVPSVPHRSQKKGSVWYFAGFDAFGGPSHLNTAWIYKGTLSERREAVTNVKPVICCCLALLANATGWAGSRPRR